MKTLLTSQQQVSSEWLPYIGFILLFGVGALIYLMFKKTIRSHWIFYVLILGFGALGISLLLNLNWF